MKMFLKISMPILMIAVILNVTSCSHSNELAKYDVRGKTAFFETVVKSNARVIKINRKAAKEEEEKSEKKKSVFAKIAEVSTEIFSTEKEADIKDWVDTYEVADEVKSGLQEALETYVDIEPVEDKKDKPDFIVELNLENCEMNISETAVSLSMRFTSTMVERVSGGLVWENYEFVNEQLDGKYGDGKKKSSTETKVLNAIILASLSEREVMDAVYFAAQEAGRKMAETFREDLREAGK